jgi:TonB family protein
LISDRPGIIILPASGKPLIKTERNFDKLVYSDVKVEDGLYFDYPQNTISNQSLSFTPAHFGTQEDHIRYLTENLRYPHESIENNSQGKVMVHIRITAEGNVQVISISNGVDIFLDCESWRVIEIMPKWTPAMKDGVPVDSYTFIPIRFTLADG